MSFRFSLLLPLLTFAILSVRGDDFPTPYNTEPGNPSPMPAEEAARTATLPSGFRCEVFASEPQVQQPIAMAFDQTGRLWVGECYTYAERPKRWDLELQDRILVLEDTTGDGKADFRKVFWDKGKRLTSVAHGHGGVWAICAPELLFIPDANNDLVPDSDPIVVLDGFDAEFIGHNVVNGLKWGPDGWLYGRHGITATSSVGAPGTPKDQRTNLNCSIWRYHPKTKAFEVFCNGGTNPWGLDWDKDGQLFYTNTVIGHLWHGIPGGYFKRMFGAHLNQHAYEEIQHTADHYHWDKGSEKWSDVRKGITGTTSGLGGGHAHIGCLIYQGGLWPKEFHDKLFTCNLHGQRINMDVLEREGVGYVAHHGKDFMSMKDSWFRGLDLLTGPDGQVWVNDWSDTGECHDSDGIHRTSGRIYRIIYDGEKKGEITLDRADWLTSRAESKDGKFDHEKLLSSNSEAQQAMGVRWLAEDFPHKKSTWRRLNKIASSKPGGLVRLELASALQRLPLEQRFALAGKLASFAGDLDDRQQPLMIWYGISDAVPAFPDKAIALAVSSKIPTVTRLITRRLCEALEQKPDVVNQLLTRAIAVDGSTVKGSVLHGMSEALQGWSQAEMPKQWEVFIANAGNDTETKALVRELSVLFGDGRAKEELLKIAGDQEADAGARRSALKNLLRQPDQELLPLLQTWINDNIIGREAILGLAHFDAPGVSARVISSWERRPMDRSVAIDTLVSRASYASDLLDAVAKNVIPRNAVSPFQARQIQSLGDEKLAARLKELWGEVRETPEEKKKELKHWKEILTADVIKSASAARGKTVFMSSCGACHKLYGEGGAFGPDLTGSDRHNIDYLLGNVVNPNDVVPADYLLTVFTLKDGRVISGVIPEENERTITVQSPAEKLVLNRDEITGKKAMPISLMPEGLLTALGEEAVRDLMAYLMSHSPAEAKE